MKGNEKRIYVPSMALERQFRHKHAGPHQPRETDGQPLCQPQRTLLEYDRCSIRTTEQKELWRNNTYLKKNATKFRNEKVSNCVKIWPIRTKHLAVDDWPISQHYGSQFKATTKYCESAETCVVAPHFRHRFSNVRSITHKGELARQTHFHFLVCCARLRLLG